MDALVALEVADGLLTLLQKVAPSIEQGLNNGTISTETQKYTASRALAACSPAAFIGPQWQPSQPAGATGFNVEPSHPNANPPQPDPPQPS